MRFLITGLGSYGDVHPMVGLAVTLQARGHQVTLVANPYFASVAQDAGVDLLPIGTRDDYLDLVHDPDLWHSFRGQRLIMRKVAADYLRPLYALLDSRAVDGETVLAAHGLDMASRLVGEKRGIPVASVNFAPAIFLSTYQSPRLPPAWLGDRVPRWLKAAQFRVGESLFLDRWLGASLNAFRQELGLRPRRRFFSQWWHETDAVLGLFPDWFAPPQPDWPAGVELVGFPLWDAHDSGLLSEEMERFLEADDRPIVFTPGSANATAESFFQAAVEACQSLGRRGILLTKYAEQLPRNLPESVRHFGFVPLSQVLPRAAAFVHHGGIGSCGQGLAAGVPQLVRPLAYDQFDNITRLVRLGVGQELSVQGFRGARVAEALDQLLNSADVGARCAELSGRCDGRAARTAAAEVLERLGTRPVAR